ncbi:hypothetical protein M413DRAFT_412254 [Hebeloma cylindrosporum]|uniref:Uncharacterized protein n=1 Tax=Hebeloma cylindrosporum TaxID=76867 RepID=A0A0C2YJJ1_HEBCY|nr:hypothetical protein M413DRAFT_412254 [Hebeloma cylindrosporum h7]
MHRTTARTRRETPSGCLSPMPLDIRGFADNSYVPAPVNQVPMPRPMPLSRPRPNSPSTSSNSESASENGGFPQQQRHYSALAVPRTPDSIRRRGDTPTRARGATGALPVPPAMHGRQSTPLRATTDRQDGVPSPNATPRQYRRPVHPSAIGPLPLTPPYVDNLSVSTSPPAIGNDIFPVQRNVIPSPKRAPSPRSRISGQNGGPPSGLVSLPSSVIPSSSNYRGPARSRPGFDNQVSIQQSPTYASRMATTLTTPTVHLPLRERRPTDPGGGTNFIGTSSFVAQGRETRMVRAPLQTGFIPSSMPVAPAPLRQTGFIPPDPPLAMYTSPMRHQQKGNPHGSRSARTRQPRRKRLASPQEESPAAQQDARRLLREAYERDHRRRAKNPIVHPPFIPDVWCPYHPQHRFYSPHQRKAHLVMPYGVYESSVSPHDLVTFDERHPCGTSAIKPKKSKLAQWLPFLFKD